ncbi:response regulator [Sphingomonas elodea]|uniref:response regulator n=1 Tax=Sphingomonas elodea TaxID=179878 RepID=UPI0002630431|nr:response regulator [Sphingomonas elodea]
MLIEDELFVALDVQDVVEEAGFAVDGPYVSVAEALEAVAARLPGCAILDVRLIDGEVFPAADVLRDAGVPIIFHSGHADAMSLRGRYPHAVVCSKPCSPRALRAAVEGVFGG